MKKNRTSYSEILRATGIIGGSQVLSLLFQMLRTKAVALLVGPSGVGILGMYNSAIEIVATVTGMGLRKSAVREVALANASGDNVRLAQTIMALRKVAVALGIVGTLVMLLLRRQISEMTFGSAEYAGPLGMLSVVIFLGSISGGQTALVQGYRRLGDLARLSVLVAGLGAITSLPFLFFWKQDGIVPFRIASACCTIIISFVYARRVRFASMKVGLADIAAEARKMMSLGIIFMVTGLLASASAYVIRVFIHRYYGLEGTGLYMAADALSTAYVGLILGAMGVDFYPKLTGAAARDSECRRMVNEQTEMGLLLLTPVLIGILTFASELLDLFFSGDFVMANEIVRWQVLGTFLRVITWPMGYIQLAKGAGKLFFFTETAGQVSTVALIALGVHWLGLRGAGVGLFAANIIYCFLIRFVAWKLIRFRWNAANKRLAVTTVPFVLVVFLAQQFLPPAIGKGMGIFIFVLSSFLSVKFLFGMIDSSLFYSWAERLRAYVRTLWR